MISKAQIHEVLKGINQREGLFTDDDLKQLDGGYSVSETEDELGSAMNDILSAHSYAKPGLGQDNLYSPQIGASPGGANAWDENVDAGEQHYR